MKRRRNAVKKIDIATWLDKQGYQKDRYGNWTKWDGDSLYRFKFNDVSLRRETKTSGDWMRLWSAYYRDIRVSETGDLIIDQKIN